ncbi:hypothetical protein F5879DRAFT_1074937 [Lentinula edodes]|nr:hypothetical protein F5879DRAFT_1074937 [Lentinula edodes]
MSFERSPQNSTIHISATSKKTPPPGVSSKTTTLEPRGFRVRLRFSISPSSASDPTSPTPGGTSSSSKLASSNLKADQVRRLRNWRITLLGGGLFIGSSAGLLAPVINVGLRTAFSTVGLLGVLMCLSGSAGAAVITTGIAGILYLNCTRSLSHNSPPMSLLFP